MEVAIKIASGPYQLEGFWQAGTTHKGVVITHPHPLYGGTMCNPVVETIQNAYQQYGYATLRFNFRGVGSSQGSYDNGAGEQKDVLAAVAFIRNQGTTAVDLVGYSFGAWVNAGVMADNRTSIESMIMVSPPVGLIEFENVNRLRCLKLVITGSRDDIAPVNQIRDRLPTWNLATKLEIIDGCDHFYAGSLDKLKSILDRYLNSAISDPT